MSEDEIMKCGYILIPKFTSKYWYFFWFLLGSLFRQCIPDLVMQSIPESEFKEKFKNPEVDKFLDMVGNILSDLFTGIFVFISKKQGTLEREKEKKNKKHNALQISFLFNDETHKTPLFRKLILTISIIDLICQIIFLIKNIIFNEIQKKNYTTKDELNTASLYSLLIIDITARYCFSWLILNTYFYAHHKLSFILNFFFALPILLIVDIIQITKNDILNYFLTFIQYTLYSLEDIIDKVALETLFIIPTALLFYKGLYQFIPFIIISIICRYFKFIQFDIPFIKQRIIAKTLFIPFNILRNIHLVKVIDIFTAQHMSHLRVWETLLLFIYTEIFSTFSPKIQGNSENGPLFYVLKCISLVILLISSLIHNEIIIINIDRFKSKTRYFLDKDAILEQNNNGLDISDSREITQSISNLNSDASQ